MTDFSIDYILTRAGKSYQGTNASSMDAKQQIDVLRQPAAECLVTIKTENNSEILSQQSHFVNNSIMFDWLQYTRYHPPKIQRNFRSGATKRTPGRLPRIPFTPAQLDALENAYKNCNYLSAEEANSLAKILNLTNTRVKIWFQNRRARERRDKRAKAENCDSTFSSNTSGSEQEHDEQEDVEIV